MNLLLEAPTQLMLSLCSDQRYYLAEPSLPIMSQRSGNFQQTFIKHLLSVGTGPGHWDAAVDRVGKLLPSRSYTPVLGADNNKY